MGYFVYLVLIFLLSNVLCTTCVTIKDNKNYTHEHYNSQCNGTSSLRGSLPAAFCAYHKNGSLNTDIIPAYAKHIVDEGRGPKGVLVNHHAFGCEDLTYTERRKNIAVWVSAGKKYGLHIWVYIAGYSLVDIMEEAYYAHSVGVNSIWIAADSLKHNSSYYIVEDLYKISHSVYPTPVGIDFEYKDREQCYKDNLVKLQRTATSRCPNYFGLRTTAADAMEIATVTNLTKCQTVLTYNSFIPAPIGSTYIAPMSSYISSIYIKDIISVNAALEQRKPSNVTLNRILTANKKFGITIRYLNFDVYDRTSYNYLEIIMRELFFCVTDIDVGRSRKYSIYETHPDLRKDFRSYLKQSRVSCLN